MDSFKSGAISVGKYFRTFYRWVLLSVVTGLVCGLVGSAFHLTVDFATSFRAQHQWLVFLLPIGGLAIALIYRVSKMEGEGTNNIIDSIHDGENVPIMLVPVIFVSTAITHLVGGSAGREGAALQIGGGIGYRVGRLLKLDDKDMRLVTLCGMSAVFAALFGTPLTATIFALEVISVGILHYSGLIPCLVASVTAYGVSLLFGIAPMRYSVALAPLEFGLLLRVCVGQHRVLRCNAQNRAICGQNRQKYISARIFGRRYRHRADAHRRRRKLQRHRHRHHRLRPRRGQGSGLGLFMEDSFHRRYHRFRL